MARHDWPDRTVISSEPLAGRRTRHSLADGTSIITGPEATHRIHYQSSWVGSTPGATYAIDVQILGPGHFEGYFTTWHCDRQVVRDYAYSKTSFIDDLESGSRMTASDLELALSTRRAAAPGQTQPSAREQHMYKLFFGLAIAALVIAIIDLQAPVGSRSATEGGFLLILATALAIAGAIAWAKGTRRCPACDERIKRKAIKCKHCGADTA